MQTATVGKGDRRQSKVDVVMVVRTSGASGVSRWNHGATMSPVHGAIDLVRMGDNPSHHKIPRRGALAQLVEQLTLNQ